MSAIAQYGLPEVVTAQTLFDKVATHLMTQGRASMLTRPHADPLCAYRGNNDTACAVGCLIEDNRYHDSFEGSTIMSSVVAHSIPGTEDHVGLLGALQSAHDHLIERDPGDVFERESLARELASIAARFDVSPVVLTA